MKILRIVNFILGLIGGIFIDMMAASMFLGDFTLYAKRMINR